MPKQGLPELAHHLILLMTIGTVGVQDTATSPRTDVLNLSPIGASSRGEDSIHFTPRHSLINRHRWLSAFNGASLRQDRCLLSRQGRCLLLRQDRCLLRRQGSALSHYFTSQILSWLSRGHLSCLSSRHLSCLKSRHQHQHSSLSISIQHQQSGCIMGFDNRKVTFRTDRTRLHRIALQF